MFKTGFITLAEFAKLKSADIPNVLTDHDTYHRCNVHGIFYWVGATNGVGGLTRPQLVEHLQKYHPNEAIELFSGVRQTRVMIVVRGGNVQYIATDGNNVKSVLLDMDNIEGGDSAPDLMGEKVAELTQDDFTAEAKGLLSGNPEGGEECGMSGNPEGEPPAAAPAAGAEPRWGVLCRFCMGPLDGNYQTDTCDNCEGLSEGERNALSDYQRESGDLPTRAAENSSMGEGLNNGALLP